MNVPRARVNCTFAKVGCTKIIRREQMPEHMREDICEHTTILLYSSLTTNLLLFT